MLSADFFHRPHMTRSLAVAHASGVLIFTRSVRGYGFVTSVSITSPTETSDLQNSSKLVLMVPTCGYLIFDFVIAVTVAHRNRLTAVITDFSSAITFPALHDSVWVFNPVYSACLAGNVTLSLAVRAVHIPIPFPVLPYMGY